MDRGVTRNRWTAVVAALTAGLLLLPAAMADARRRIDYSPGSPGLGDSYYPLDGNGGYRVRHYGLKIRYNPANDRLVGRARIKAVARKDLSRFNLDFRGLNLSSITVDGARARWKRRRGHELVITPKQGLRQGRVFEVIANYAGVPKLLQGALGEGGVFRTDDGAVIVGQPQVAATWFPVNDHPSDKATYTIHLKVPAGLEAISNGRLMSRSGSGGWRTWTWSGGGKMASYLATAAIGQFDVRRYRTADGVPVLDAVDSQIGNRAHRVLAKGEAIVRFLAHRFGPYPFSALGGIVERHELGFALETQTRPVYDSIIFTEFDDAFATSFVVHELAHMWYGDSVAVRDWRHIWLNEGPATYAEWLWSGANGRQRPREIFASLCSVPRGNEFWDLKTGDPGPANLFDYEAVYLRGAMTLQALRSAVGAETFFDIMRTWATERRGGTGGTSQFKALAERLSERQLDGLFRQWLFRAAKPRACGRAQPAAGASLPRLLAPARRTTLEKGAHNQ